MSKSYFCLLLVFAGTYALANEPFPLNAACMAAVKDIANGDGSFGIHPFDDYGRFALQGFVRRQSLADIFQGDYFKTEAAHGDDSAKDKAEHPHYKLDAPVVSDASGWEQSFYTQTDNGNWVWGLKVIYNDKDQVREIQEILPQGEKNKSSTRQGASIAFDYESGECKPHDVSQLSMTPRPKTKPVQWDTKRFPLADAEVCKAAPAADAFYKSKLAELQKLDRPLNDMIDENTKENSLSSERLTKIRKGQSDVLVNSDYSNWSQERKNTLRAGIQKQIGETYQSIYEATSKVIPERGWALNDEPATLQSDAPQRVKDWLRSADEVFNSVVRSKLEEEKRTHSSPRRDYFSENFKESFSYVGLLQARCQRYGILSSAALATPKASKEVGKDN